jgi:putative redox protein
MAEEVSVRIGKERYTTEVTLGNHTITADEPTEVGGQDLGPAPLQLLLSSLGTCKAITMRMYADRKEWPLDSIEVILSSETVKSDLQQTTYIRCTIKLYGDLEEKQKERIYKIADKCPIHKTLTNPIVIESNRLP